MEGLVNPLVIETLIGAAGGGQWWRLVGAILVVVVAVVRYVTADRFTVVVVEWISAVSALVGGFAAALLAGTVWWHALIIGLVVSSSSRGLWDRVRKLLPKRPNTPIAIALLLIVPVASGCSGYTPTNNACRIEGAVVGALSLGLSAAESVVGDRGGEDWDTTLMAARGALTLGSEAVRACELARDGAAWQQWVALALETAGAVAAFIDGAGPADVMGSSPPELVRAIEMLEQEIRMDMDDDA